MLGRNSRYLSNVTSSVLMGFGIALITKHQLRVHNNLDQRSCLLAGCTPVRLHNASALDSPRRLNRLNPMGHSNIQNKRLTLSNQSDSSHDGEQPANGVLRKEPDKAFDIKEIIQGTGYSVTVVMMGCGRAPELRFHRTLESVMEEDAVEIRAIKKPTGQEELYYKAIIK